MTAEEITEREESLTRYCARIDRWCRELDSEPDRTIVGLPWVTKERGYTHKPEIRYDC